ncbi:hypothetical protein DPMN_013130 [Dreissena polymorpha]|uniref:Uncharacterized protein n=1 Tax=Dreissena polymorpha TaxID=45954 RepID=A0A9D4S246_DREPO|nr:hypothetical protein DPMN_013130 [Dreissena polymorpha]
MCPMESDPTSIEFKVLTTYLKLSRVRFLDLDPVLGVFGEDVKNAPTVGIEPVTSRSLGEHHINYTTVK